MYVNVSPQAGDSAEARFLVDGRAYVWMVSIYATLDRLHRECSQGISSFSRSLDLHSSSALVPAGDHGVTRAPPYTEKCETRGQATHRIG